MKIIIQPVKVWDPQGKYSQAILSKAGQVLFISGQTSVDEERNIVGKMNIEIQTRQVLENIKVIAEEAGGSLENIVRLTTYVTDARSLPDYYKTRKEYFKKDPPTSTTVVVTALGREDLLVEVEAMAVLQA